ncbi:hypothetical protein IKQ26_08750 [bacterium]|nr:hypothetical protein [bacterium]
MNTIDNKRINTNIIQPKRINLNKAVKHSSLYSLSRKQQNVSFKGAEILVSKAVKFNDYDKLIKIFDKAYDGTGQRLLSELSETITQAGSRIHKNANSLVIDEKSFFRNLAESALFPVTKLPLHILNFLTDVGRKIPLISKGAQKLYDSSTLTKLRNSVSADTKTDMLRGILDSTQKAIQPLLDKGETLDTLISKPGRLEEVAQELFKKSNKFFNTATGNYNTAYERPLNRIVTGLIPATFLANDAYNLAIMCGDNKDKADKEANSRKKQEISRVLLNAYIQLVTLGTFTKLINSNAVASAMISAGTVLVAETFGRLANNRPIFFLTKEKAVEFNKKLEDKEKNKSERKSFIFNLFRKNKKEDENKVKNTNTVTHVKSADVKEKRSFKADNKPEKPEKKEEKKTVVTFDTLKKIVVGLSLGGIALAFLKNSTALEKIKPYKALKNSIKSVGDFFTNNVYNKLCKKDFKVDVNDFNKTMNKLEEVGLPNIAQTYKDIAGDLTGKSEIILKNGNKVLQTTTKAEPYVNALLQPFKFLISVVTLPYRIIRGVIKASTNGIETKLANGEKVSSLSKAVNKAVTEVFGASKPKKPQTLNDIFAYSIPNLIKKAQNVESGALTNQQFKDFVQTSIQRSFNNISQSKTSNTELAMITKLASSTVTSAFLIADNYNMVMLKSNGEDKENALQKAKERLVQRISGIFYQTLFMKWFNSTFQATYHKSLLGMSAVCGSNTLATEFFTRKSIGMPITRKSLDELIALDEKNLNRKGLAGKYFRFMSQLTGKKSLGERVASDSRTKNAQKQETKISPVKSLYIPSDISKLK